MFIRFFTMLFLFVGMNHDVNGQLCQGSLGDPIINTTFGSGSNPGPPLSAAATNYLFAAGDCPPDGSYTVRNNTNACFGTSWHSLASDHTGNPGGYFMLVNASIQPNAFYLDTVRGLCGNSTYEFAAWVMNVLLPASCFNAGIQPDLTFSIERTDGTILQSYNTNGIAATSTPTWKQYGFFFTTPPAGSDIVLRIFNNAPGGCGNDLALDDITFRPCGPRLTPSIIGMATTSASLCEGIPGNYTFSCAVSGGFINPAVQWQQRFNGGAWSDIPAETTTTLTRNFPVPMPIGNYEYRLVVAEAGNMASTQCRIASQPLRVQVNANPATSALNDGPACENKSIVLTATGGAQYDWTGPNAFTGSGSPLTLANVQFAQAGKYYVLVSSSAGCTHKDSTTILVNPNPNAATSISTTTICEKDSVQLNAIGGTNYLWQPSSGLSNATIANPKASPSISTTYSAIVSNQFGCKDTATTLVNIVLKPIVDAGPDRIMLQGQSIQLTGSINDPANSFSWSPATNIDDIHSLQPFVDPPVDTKYILNVVSGFGCGIASDTMFVKVYKNIFVPGAFSPNGDGRNDTWNIPALAAYPFFEVFVYSRWGQLVFHTKNTARPWNGTFNGKPLPVGAYNYFINVGISQDTFKGSVMIIR